MRLAPFLFHLALWSALFLAPAPAAPLETPDLIPIPKQMQAEQERFPLRERGRALAEIVVEEPALAPAAAAINDRILELGGEPLPVVARSGRPGANAVRIALLKEGVLQEFPDRERDLLASLFEHGEQAYALRFRRTAPQAQEALLAGAGRQGALHAAASFALLVQREGDLIYAVKARVDDWPDFKNRGLPVWPLPASFAEFKRYVDWAARYKFNRIYTHATREGVPDGFDLATAKERRYLRRINEYARERGIRINYALTWAVADAGPGSAASRGVAFNGRRYLWGDDDLLARRGRELARFAAETGAQSLNLHCLDSFEEGWGGRDARDRARFGEDRAAADANVVNILSREIRRLNPGIELQFVLYPYHVNLDLPGNAHYRRLLERVSRLVPADVHLVLAELNRDQADSWVAAVRQPLVHWVNGQAFQWGRHFSTLPAYTKSAYYPERERDVAVHMEPIGPFQGEVLQLVAAQYLWNVSAPGSGMVVEERGEGTVIAGGQRLRRETVDGVPVSRWGWYRGTEQPGEASGELLLKACRLEYGREAAPHLAEFFRNSPAGGRTPASLGALLGELFHGEEAKGCLEQQERGEKALAALKRGRAAAKDPARARIEELLGSCYRQLLVIEVASSGYRARELALKSLSAQAEREVALGFQRLARIRGEMESAGVWNGESLPWYREGERRLKGAQAGAARGRLANLIRNPGFEERETGSTRPAQWSGSGLLESAGKARSGKRGGRLTLKAGDPFVFAEQRFPVRPGCRAYVEFRLGKEGGFRAIPMLQYRDAAGGKVEAAAVDDFPSGEAPSGYRLYAGEVALPPGTGEATFKIYADWFGFHPSGERTLHLDDVFVGCLPEPGEIPAPAQRGGR